jgi:hypothetical protein
MKKFITTSQWCAAVGVAALLLNGGVAYAATPDLRLCQAGIEKETIKFNAAVSKAISLCADAVRKEQVKDAASAAKVPPVIINTIATAAHLCEVKLAAVYDVTNAKPGKSAVDKFKANVDKLFTIPKCDPTFLTKYGHLASPTSAPGAATQSFLEDSLLSSSESAAINQAIAQIGDTMGLILAAQTAADSKSPCTSSSNCATDCTNNAALGFRPNLCAFNVECQEHACTLSGSSSTLASAGVLGTIPLSLTGRSLFGICILNHGGQAWGTSGFQYTIGGPSKTLDPVSVGSGITVCVNTNRAEGWCDCTTPGAGLAKNTTICQDRIVNFTGSESTTDGCGSATSLATNDTQGFGETKIGDPLLTLGGSSTNGDCVNLFTTQFTIFGAPCTNLPGDPCGPDHTVCTADDQVAPQAPATVPLTTGTASATVQEAVNNPGGCAGDAGTTSCIEDRNCSACISGLCPDGLTACTSDAACSAAPGGTCSVPAPTLVTITVGPVTGAKTNCTNYNASTMSGVSFVGAFPGAGGNPPIGDSATSFLLHCM